MIEINLLPESRKTSPGTPIPYLIIVLVAVAGLTAEVGIGAYLWYQRRDLLQEKENLQNRKESLQPAVDKYKTLKAEIEQLKKRRDVLENIKPKTIKERYRWSKSVDHLFTVVEHSPGVWLVNLDGTTDVQRGGRRNRGPSRGEITHKLEFEARAAGDLTGLTKFEERIKRRLLEKEGVYTRLRNKWRDYKKGEAGEDEYVEDVFWAARYVLENHKKPSQQKGGGPGSP